MSEKALGTKILINANVIAGLTSINGVALTKDTKDVTTLEDTDGYRRFKGGLKDGGEVSISGFFEAGDEDGQQAFYTAFDSDDPIPFSIVMPQGAAWTFSGIVTGFSTGAELEDEISFEGTIKVSGKPDLAVIPSAGLSNLALNGAGGSLSPAFDAGIRYYTFDDVTADSVTVTATGAGQKIKLFVDGVYVQDLASGSASVAIPLTVGSKKITIMANEAGKAPKIYDVIVIKTS